MGTLVVVVFKRKRKEFFLIATPSFFLAASLGMLIYALTIDMNDALTPLTQSLKAVIYFCSGMGHWFFASQYLRTSLTLPELLAEAKLEWTLDDV